MSSQKRILLPPEVESKISVMWPKVSNNLGITNDRFEEFASMNMFHEAAKMNPLCGKSAEDFIEKSIKLVIIDMSEFVDKESFQLLYGISKESLFDAFYYVNQNRFQEMMELVPNGYKDCLLYLMLAHVAVQQSPEDPIPYLTKLVDRLPNNKPLKYFQAQTTWQRVNKDETGSLWAFDLDIPEDNPYSEKITVH